MSVVVKLRPQDIEAGLSALRSGWLTMGPRTQALEREVATRLGVAHAIAVSSGAAGLQLACLAAARDGAAVVSALAPAATVSAAAYGGRAVHVADAAGADAPAMTPLTVMRAADPDTRVVVVSHLAGRPADADELRGACDARGWVLVEDATAALGATLADGRRAGTAGHLGVFDFAAGRLVAVGEGGVVVTDDDGLAQRVRHLRTHGMTSVTWDRHRGHAETYDVVAFGFNFRIDEPRAAMAASQFERLDDLVRARRALEAAVVIATGAMAPPRGGAPEAVPVVLDDAVRRAEVAAALVRHGVPARSWPDPWPPGRMPPVAADARERTVLVDLAASQAAGVDAAGLGQAVAEALRDA